MSSNSGADINNTSDNRASSSRLPRAKLSAVARLKSFGESFIGSREAPQTVMFPPPSWELSDELLGRRNSPALLESNFNDHTPKVEPPEAVPFAKRLRALIESLPISLPGASSSQPASTDPALEPDAGTQGSPVPPGMDEGLVRMLSSEDLMNGKPSTSSNAPEQERPGIWNILASLKRDDGKAAPRPSAVEEEEGGFMMYSPLEPKNDSQLELAQSETSWSTSTSPHPLLAPRRNRARALRVRRQKWRNTSGCRPPPSCPFSPRGGDTSCTSPRPSW